MSDLNLKNLKAAPVVLPDAFRPPIGQFLVQQGTISKSQLDTALARQSWLRAPLGEIIVAEGWATRDEVKEAISLQHGVQSISFTANGSDPELARAMPASFWLHNKVLPWIRIGDTVLIATARPDKFDDIRASLQSVFPVVLPVLASDPEIQKTIAERFQSELAAAASARVSEKFSFRTWTTGKAKPLAMILLAVCAVFGILAPAILVSLLVVLSALTLILFTALKLSGFAFHLLGRGVDQTDTNRNVVRLEPLPMISMLVPLYKEQEIATRLVERLSKLDYPKALLDVILVLEAHDAVTQNALNGVELPVWMRPLIVPEHEGLTTKPRAMNYALDFCHGSIVGIWDAEDAPAPDQLTRVARRFAKVPEDVICLQGILDFYNPNTNWLSRCFSIEYASWFRVVLNGLANLGLVIPLGGTTVFFKRRALENLGAWDAHNVTEDADLGVRIFRSGFRTELIDTSTYEEANCRLWPWVKQRSRWLKGFMVTYLVHMRHPPQLLRDLGLKRFLGFQAFFLGTLGQFLLAPLLWSFWLVALGLAHPAEGVLGKDLLITCSIGLIGFELLAIAIGCTAVRAAGKPSLIPWTMTMTVYFLFGTVAVYKALYELICDPFFWDKTEHGHDPGNG